MKKLTALTLALLLALTALTGCGNQETTEAPTTETTAAPTTASQEAENTASSETTAAPEIELDYSKYLDDYGYIEGVDAKSIVGEIDYSKAEIKKSDLRSSAEYAVKSVIASLTSQYSVEDKNPEREVQDGDTLSIGYVGKTKDDGVAFEGGSTDETEVTIGVTSYIDGFLPQLIGHHPGETFDIEVTFPDPYSANTELSGKAAIFTITIHCIKNPVFDDAFIKEHWDDIKDFPKAVDGMTVEELRQAFYDYYYDYYTDSAVYSAVADMELEVEVPEAVVNYVENADDCTYREQYGISLRDLLGQYYGYSDDKILEILKEEGVRELIFQAYYEERGWQVTESDYHEATGSDDNAETIEKLGKGYIARYVMLERALDELREKVTFIDD